VKQFRSKCILSEGNSKCGGLSGGFRVQSCNFLSEIYLGFLVCPLVSNAHMCKELEQQADVCMAVEEENGVVVEEKDQSDKGNIMGLNEVEAFQLKNIGKGVIENAVEILCFSHEAQEKSPMDKEMQWVQDEVGLLLEATLKENVTEEVVKKIGTPVKVYQEAQQKFGLLQETVDSDMNCGEKTEAKGGVGFAPEPAPDKCIAEEVVKKLNPVKITREAFKKDKDMEAQKKMNLPQDTAGTFRFSQQAPGGVMTDDEGKLAQENCVLAAQKKDSLGDVAECAHRPLYPHLEFHEKAVEKKADNMQAAEEDVSEKEMSRAKSKPYTQLAAQGKEAVGMEDKAKEMKDPNELLVWPPTVVIENTRTGKTEDGRWTGIGNVEMACFLKGMIYKPSMLCFFRLSVGPSNCFLLILSFLCGSGLSQSPLCLCDNSRRFQNRPAIE